MKAYYGLLTNGTELLLYKRINQNYDRRLRVNLQEISLDECKTIYESLRNPEYDLTKVNQILSYFDRFRSVDERTNLLTDTAREHFFDIFELKKGSVFSSLVLQTLELFKEMYEESKFLTSAYDFWKKYYARKPEKIPENWKNIIGTSTIDDEDLYEFMFCLETAYALFTRLILIKTCEDYEFPDIEFTSFIERDVNRYAFRGDFPLVAWSVLLTNMIEEMRVKLVESVFEEDVFYWWTDFFSDLSRDKLFTVRSAGMSIFGQAVGRVLLTLYKFDFSEVAGDPLGTLYQRHFDKETRKALGEFYTPLEVVEHIIDNVEYRGASILEERFLDPACGSGTFLVEALRRYLDESKQVAEKEGWSSVLNRLCSEFHIVGFDIHPFATIMAQIQFMLTLVPYYRKAVDEDSMFLLKRLPIFRTDSLEFENRNSRISLENPELITLKLKLPIVKEGDFLELEITVPNINTALSEETGLYNVPEYFAALQAVFDYVKGAAKDERVSTSRSELEYKFKEYLVDKNWDNLGNFF